jgi:hypothetical protein
MFTTNNRKDFDLPTMTISKVTCSEPKPLTPANNNKEKKEKNEIFNLGAG